MKTKPATGVLSAAFAACVLSAMLLIGCTPVESEPTLSVAQLAEAKSLAQRYQSARAAQQWEVAESFSEQLKKKYPGSEPAQSIEASLLEVHRRADEQREARRLADLWEYQAVATGGGVQRSASIDSRTLPAMEGELAPPADAQLVLRDHPAWGRSAYLLLAQSRFSCGKPCVLKISFDGSQTETFAGKQADSGKGPALFIEDEQRFIAAMQKARQVRFELPKGSGTLHVLSFDVDGYLPERFEKSASR